MDNWVIEFLNKIEFLKDIKVDIDGQEVLVNIGKEVLDSIRDNYLSLIRIGRNTFKEALLLMSKGDDFNALVKIYEHLDNNELLDKYKEDTIKLAEVAAQVQVDKDFWISFCKTVGTKVVFAALGALL